MSAHPDLTLLQRYAQADRRAVLRHIQRCRACRVRLVEQEGAEALFRLLALDEVPAESLAAVSAGVAAALGPRHPLRRGAAAAWAASILLAALLVGGVLLRPATSIPDTALIARGAPRAGVAVLSSPGEARVVDLTVGETQVVMIFDPGLDL